MTPKFSGYRACTARHLTNLCRGIDAAFRTDVRLGRFWGILRRVGAKSTPGAALARTTLVPTELLPTPQWLERYDSLFEEALGSLEAFRPAAGKLPEYERLSARVRNLGKVIGFARGLERGSA